MAGEYTAVLAAIHARLSAIAALKVKYVGEPPAVQEWPALYSVLVAADWAQVGQIDVRRYQTQHRVLVNYQDRQQGEQELAALVDGVLDALGDPYLAPGQQITEVLNIRAGWIDVGDTEFRVLEFTTKVLVKQ